MPVQEFVLSTKTGELTFTGRELGYGTSKTVVHTNHGGYEYVSEVPGTDRAKCSACRWNVVRIYLRTGPERGYVAYTEGVSRCPGEVTYSRIIEARGGVELVDALTVRSKRGEAFLPRPASQALAQAAEDDDSVYDAFNDRRVA